MHFHSLIACLETRERQEMQVKEMKFIKNNKRIAKKKEANIKRGLGQSRHQIQSEVVRPARVGIKGRKLTKPGSYTEGQW